MKRAAGDEACLCAAGGRGVDDDIRWGALGEQFTDRVDEAEGAKRGGGAEWDGVGAATVGA